MSRKSLLRAWICVVLVPAFANATPVVGEFGMGGSAGITATSVDYFCALGSCPATNGDFTVSPITTTGSFAALGSTKGFIKDINMLGGQPLNTSFSLPTWISFVAAPTLFLDLQFIPVGQGTPSADCVGVTFCTPTMAALVSPNNPLGLSPYNLGPGSASLELRGIGYTGASATGSTPFIGRVSADFAGLSAANILALLSSGTANRAYSANFVVSVIPELAAGDYNQNGTVDAADYTTWRDNLGSTTALPNDDTPGVGPDDYDRWQTNFGTTAGAGASGPGSAGGNAASSPEPASLFLLVFGSPTLLAIRRRRVFLSPRGILTRFSCEL